MYGNKADNLILLRDKGFNVPSFEVVDETTFNQNYVTSLNGNLYSVRSSASCEDGDKTSFAGQFDTFLNVKKEELNDTIKKCFDSMNDEKVKEYIKTINDFKKYVIVQEMVESDFSGVIFTSNPQGLLNETVVVCGRGLGENVVQDKVNITTYYYNLNDDIYYYEGSENLLNNYLINEIIMTSKKIVSELGDYLDIEFAIKDNLLYILQARKITTINGKEPLILDNSNIVESYPGISLPLTISFVEFVYSGVFKSAIKRIVKNDNEVELRKDVFNNMVGSANGRIYYKISNWYEIICCLPFSNRIVPVWQEMMGVKNKAYNKEKYKLSPIVKAKTYINFYNELKHVSENMILLNNKFETIYDEYKQKFKDNLSIEETFKLYDKIANELFSCWDITLINDLYTFIYTSILKSKIKKEFSNYEEIANNLISGNKDIESLKPINELITLAYEKDNNDKAEFEKKVYDYIDKYGDRCIEELKLESQTFRTDPNLLFEKIEEYRKDMNKLSIMYKNIDKESSIQDIKLSKKVEKILVKCQEGIKNREKSRLNRAKIYGICREMFLHIAKMLVLDNKLEDERDIFYLTISEIKSNVDDFKEIVNHRKNEYEIYYKLPSYSRLVFDNKEFNKSHISINREFFRKNKNELKGIPCSNGNAEGEVIVIDGQNLNISTVDKIIVTKMTDPGYVFLIANCKGIISEKGSLLSHTAIIARELKVPFIVGVDKLLEELKTGDIVRMDASSGIIEIIKRAEDKND